MTKPRIAVVEDDFELQALLARGLTEEGFQVETVATGAELLERVDDLAPDALVVDIGLPDADGRDVCQGLRAHGIDAPVLFLTARGQLTDKLAAFHAGGDDYLTKPFALAELLVRVRALLKRQVSPRAQDGLRLDPAKHGASAGDRTEQLTPTEFRLLAALVAQPGVVVRRRELVSAAWPDGAIVHDNTLDAYVARIRRKLRAAGANAGIADSR